jgi:hypothetical protein
MAEIAGGAVTILFVVGALGAVLFVVGSAVLLDAGWKLYVSAYGGHGLVALALAFVGLILYRIANQGPRA